MEKNAVLRRKKNCSLSDLDDIHGLDRNDLASRRRVRFLFEHDLDDKLFTDVEIVHETLAVKAKTGY